MTMSSFKLVEPYVEGRVLDVGCRTGEYLSKFHEDSLGIDIKDEYIIFCKELKLNAITHDVNQGLPKYKGRFDTFFLSHIIEHIRNPVDLIEHLKDIGTKNHIVIIGLPIEKNLINFILKEDYYNDHKGHLYAFSMKGICHVLQSNNYEIQKIFYELPKSRLFIGLYQHLPERIKERISNSYWVIARSVN